MQVVMQVVARSPCPMQCGQGFDRDGANRFSSTVSTGGGDRDDGDDDDSACGIGSDDGSDGTYAGDGADTNTNDDGDAFRNAGTRPGPCSHHPHFGPPQACRLVSVPAPASPGRRPRWWLRSAVLSA